MQPGLDADHPHRIAQCRRQRGQQRRPALVISAADATNVPLIGAALDQFSQSFLFQARRVPIGKPLRTSNRTV
jgi:hypothetical protein